MGAKKTLRKARAVIADIGWNQGGYAKYELINPKDDSVFGAKQLCGVCAVGAIHMAIHGQPYSPGNMKLEAKRDKALVKLAKAIGGRKTSPPFSTVANFNDNKLNSKEAILAVFDKAIGDTK